MGKPFFKVHFTYVDKTTREEIDVVHECMASDPDEARKMAFSTIKDKAHRQWVRKIKRVRT